MLFDAALRSAGSAQQEFAQHFPAPGWVEHDPEEIWATVSGLRAAVLAKAGLKRRRRGRDRHHQPARNHRGLGPRDRARRSITPSSGKTAAPPPLCDALQGRGARGRGPAPDRAAARPLLFGHQAGVDSRSRAGRAGAGRGGRTGLRHRRQLSDLAADRRAGACDRRHQCRAHHALRHPRQGAGTRHLCARLGVPMAMLPEVRDCAADFGTTEPALFGRRHRHLGVAGDQQAATIGQACFAARHAEVDLWHRLLCAAEHRRATGAKATTGFWAPSPISWRASPPMRSKARSSLRGPRCNGCATG